MRDRAKAGILASSVVAACVSGFAWHTRLGLTVTAVATAAAATVVLAGVVRLAQHHAALTRRLRRTSRPGRVSGADVRIGDHGTVLVAGLLRPTIFCDGAVLDRLDADERAAVVLHERAHQRAHDPLRLLLIRAVAPLVSWSPAGLAWLDRRLAAREIAADRFALSRGARRGAIASALLKVPPAPAGGFTSAVDLRIQALVEGDADPGRRRVGAPHWVIVGAVTGVVACWGLAHTLLG